MSELFDRVDDFIKSNSLLVNNGKLLLAVSGGMDSMLLLHYFLNRGNNIGVAHCNFGLRGAESDADQALVNSFCTENSIPFYCKRFDTEEYSRHRGISIQMAARQLRYEWFEQICDLNNYSYLITAHHLTDHVETVLLNQLRGTGPKGLEGIKAKSGNKLRPLLCLSRSEIELIVKQLNIPYREDLSNQSDKYHRNRLRHHVLPQFAIINPDYEQTFFQNSEHIKQGNAFVEHFMDSIKKDLITLTQDGFILHIKKLETLPQPAFILHNILQPFNFNSAQISDIYRTIGCTSGKIFYSDTYRLVTHNIQWVLEKIDKKPSEEYTITESTPHILTSHFHWKFEYTELNVIEKDKNIACFDCDKIQFPLTIRNWLQGDKIKPLGMKGHKKISDVLIDKKLSVSQKDKIEVLVSGKDIIWIAGLQINEDYKITQQTNKIYKVALEPKTNS